MRSRTLALTFLSLSISINASAGIVKIDLSAGALAYAGTENMSTISYDLIKLQTGNSKAFGHNDVRFDLSYRNMYHVDPETGLLGFGDIDSDYVDLNYSYAVNFNDSAHEQAWTDSAQNGFRSTSGVSSATTMTLTPNFPDNFTSVLLGIDNRSVSLSNPAGSTLDSLTSPADEPGDFVSLSWQGTILDSMSWDSAWMISPLTITYLEEVFFDPFDVYSGYDTGLAGADQATIDQYLDTLPSGFDLSVMLEAATAAELGGSEDGYHLSAELLIRHSESAADAMYANHFPLLNRYGRAFTELSVFGLSEGSYSVQSGSIGESVSVPEPGTVLLLSTGLASLMFVRRRQRQAASANLIPNT